MKPILGHEWDARGVMLLCKTHNLSDLKGLSLMHIRLLLAEKFTSASYPLQELKLFQK